MSERTIIEQQPTIVCFRKDRDGYTEAVFPFVAGNGNENTMTGYSSTDAHYTASIDWVNRDTTNATEEEYKPVKNALLSIGYFLEITDWDDIDHSEATRHRLREIHRTHVDRSPLGLWA